MPHFYNTCFHPKITETSNPYDIEQAVNFYRDDLPNPSIVYEEFHRWKAQWLSKPVKDRPNTLNNYLLPESIPNIFMLLKTICYIANDILLMRVLCI